MKKIIYILIIILFVISTIFISNKLCRYEFEATGIVKYHKSDITVTADIPEGYFFESDIFGFVYLEYENIDNYLGEEIVVKGYINKIKDNSAYKIYPKIDVKEIELINMTTTD
jgi:hypothetical protein